MIDLESFSERRTFDLPGEWGFDAISPDGRWLYLVQQLSRTHRTRYAIRAYDLRAGRLLPDPVVDPSEPDEQMQGFPITRATGPGGRWEYTLYGGGRGHPFIHALDTLGRTSICIDLPHRVARHRRLFELELAVRGSRVKVVDGEKVIATKSHRPPRADEAGTGTWTLAAGTLALLLVAGLSAARRRRA